MQAIGGTSAVVTRGSTINHHSKTNAFLHGLLVLRQPSGHVSSSTTRDFRWHRPVSAIANRLPSLYIIDMTCSRDSEHPRNLSAVNRNPLVGSTCMCGPASGDSFSLLCLVLLGY